ncbi:hypothetical protein FSW04_21330 [Baekduia soli]|uniref:DUF2867 domain-containing protein n=1 Tax=Baekduia soli TaxID=496014 RepID=A0A5B8UA11_9ACTN|nr:hypothetical protein [Baekduia soli]QEC49857.1 hypothetical protein FSW04_21330 [Baekduia soli]
MDLDTWLAAPLVRTHHRRRSDAAPDVLWDAASSVRLGDCRVLGRLIRARIPGLPAALTFRDMFGSDPFNILETGDRHLLSGLCGRIWTVRRDFSALSAPEDFLTWRVPGTVRVLFATWVEPAHGGSVLVSEVRVAPVDRRAGMYVRGLGPFIAAFQGLVAVEPMGLAVQRARPLAGS